MKDFSTCQVERQFIRKSGTINVHTGVFTERSVETVTEPCNTPLFTGDDRKHGVCRSCADMWEVEGNVITPTGRKYIEESKS